MSSNESENYPPRPLRRSARHSSGKAVGSEPTPRPPIKRTRNPLVKQAPVPAVNGSRDSGNGSEDGESASKKSRQETEGVGAHGDGSEVEVPESAVDMETDELQEMDETPDPSQDTHQPKLFQYVLEDVKLSPRVVLGDRCRPHSAIAEDGDQMKSKRGPEAKNKSATQNRPLLNSHDLPETKITSMEDYKRRMKAIVKRSDIPTAYKPTVRNRGYPASEKSYPKQQYENNIPKPKVTVQRKKQVMKKTVGPSSRGFLRYLWYLFVLVLLALLSAAVCLLPYNTTLVQRWTGTEHPTGVLNSELFADQLSLLETQFPSQRPELWKRSKIHLERHLRTAQPTEPVSIILTAGLRAEKTLHCLARRLASSFSSALNSSVLHIDGASKASQDSDQVKLDIDGQLQAAFEGDKPVAVIHRFEELPPGSTLIFYRYCDHENAAYKQVFLLFTVLLPQDEVVAGHSLKDVDEMVQDYVKERLVGSGKQAGFDAMDSDKYGGLWSRISHLILPVVSEKEVEQRGCS